MFNKVIDTHLDTLNLYVPTVKRVHGESHPEFYKVSDLYEELIDKYTNKKDLSAYSKIFEDLKEATDSYKIPSDVCETYTKVYKMLEEISNTYYQVIK